MIHNSQPLNERIRELRKKAGYSQQQMAQKLHLTQGAISQWENGITVPAAEQLSALADVFEISVDELLGRDPGIKKEAPSIAGLRDGLIDLLVDLSPEEEAQLRAFVAGMKANRKP